MLYLKSWLNDYINMVDLGLNDTELSNLISTKSHEVDEVITLSDRYDNKVLVGQIKNIIKHPNADTLRMFDVIIGGNVTVKIVSAAPNVVDNMLVPVAIEGANLNGLIISPRKMRGETSYGMCCGKSELNCEDIYSLGLWDLSFDGVTAADIGKSICVVLPDIFAGDTIFDIKVLPDKIGKLGSHLSMALEIANITGRVDLLKSEAKEVYKINTLEATDVSIIEDFKRKMSSQFRAVEADNNISKPVKSLRQVVDSAGYVNNISLLSIKLNKAYTLPATYRYRMNAISENLTGNIADLSNYYLKAFGQPTHFFDGDKLDLMADFKFDNTEFVTEFEGLGNFKKSKLPPFSTVLTNGDKIIAVPGVSGGKDTSITESTVNLVLEVASFDSVNLSKNTFKIDQYSSASKIYSGNPSQLLTLMAQSKILEELVVNNLISEFNIISLYDKINGNEISTTAYIDNVVNDVALSNKPIKIDYEYIKSRLSIDGITDEEINNILSAQGSVKHQFFSPNLITGLIDGQDDILREVVKVVGYDNVNSKSIITDSSKVSNRNFINLINLKKYIANCGFYEIITRPFVSDSQLEALDIRDNLLELTNPYRHGISKMRSTLTAGQLSSLSLNVLDGHKDVRVFEIAPLYTHNNNTSQIEEKASLSFSLLDDAKGGSVMTLTTMIKDLLNRLNLANFDDLIVNTTITKVGNVVSYSLPVIDGDNNDGSSNKVLTTITEVGNLIKKAFNLPSNKRVFVVDIALPIEITEFNQYNRYYDESLYPSIARSYNLIINNSLTQATLTKNILSLAPDNGLRLRIDCVERVYAAPDDVSSKDKLTLSIRYQAMDRTLSQEDISVYEQYLSQYIPF